MEESEKTGRLQLTIYRDRWARGGMNGTSMLLNSSHNCMCCLGFLGAACGYTAKQMRDMHSPADMLDHHLAEASMFPEGMVTSKEVGDWYSSPTTMQLMCVNDSREISEEEREEKIRGLMGQLKVDVSFIDTEPKPG